MSPARKKATSRRKPARPGRTRTRRGVHAAGGAAIVARCAILTVSDTRGEAQDVSGALAALRLEVAGHRVVARHWVRDEAQLIRRAVLAMLRHREVDAIVLTGGTGIAPRDVTPEALAPLLEKTLPGFGEMFRALSAAEIGSAAWLSRAGAGIAQGRLVVFLPGSPDAVQLGLDEVLIPELPHVLRMLGRVSQGD